MQSTNGPARAGTRGRVDRGSLLARAGLAIVALSLAAAPAVAQETEDCHCELPRIVTQGNVFSLFGNRPMLGVSLDMSLDREMEDTGGVRITDVVEDGPADEAGIQAGDVVVSLDGHDLAEALDDRTERRLDEGRSFPGQRLTALARELDEGEPVEMVVLRDGERMTFTVTPEELDTVRISGNFLPDVTRRLSDLRGQLQDMDWSFDWDDRGDPVAVAPRVHVSGEAPFFEVWGPVGGLELVEVNESLGSYFGTDRGVLVADVESDSSLGLEPGDVVLDVDGRAVESPGHLRRILGSYRDGEAIEFRIMREGQEVEVSGEMG